MTINLWSAIYGMYDKPKPLEIYHNHYNAILWSDEEFDNPDMGWHFVRVPLRKAETSMMRAKMWKTLAPANYLNDGAILIWIDGSMRVTEPKLIEKCLEALGDDDASFMRHPDRNCLYEEALFSLQFLRYQNVGIESLTLAYAAENMPLNWGLIATGFFVIRIGDWTRQLLADWWQICLQCHQDQISLPFLLWRSKQTKWNYNLPYGEWWEREEHLVRL